MSNEKTFFQDDVVAEILQRAKKDIEFKKMLFDDPQEALSQFGVTIPIASGKNYLETVYTMYDRAEFYRLFHLIILNEIRDDTVIMAQGPCVTATDHENVDWDFEVTNYRNKLIAL